MKHDYLVATGIFVMFIMIQFSIKIGLDAQARAQQAAQDLAEVFAPEEPFGPKTCPKITDRKN